MAPRRGSTTEHGLVPKGDGWFALNRARRAGARRQDAVRSRNSRVSRSSRSSASTSSSSGQASPCRCTTGGRPGGLPRACVGQALLIVEGEERPLRQWDRALPRGDKAHDRPAPVTDRLTVLAVGAREHQTGADWGGYTIDEAALRHYAGVEDQTNDPEQAYAPVPRRERSPYRGLATALVEDHRARRVRGRAFTGSTVRHGSGSVDAGGRGGNGAGGRRQRRLRQRWQRRRRGRWRKEALAAEVVAKLRRQGW